MLHYRCKGKIKMYAEKLIVTTDNFGNLQAMPKLPANKQFEAVFLIIENDNPPPHKRQPHPDIAGRVKLIGDIINTTAQVER
jgi:hypothetical protein